MDSVAFSISGWNFYWYGITAVFAILMGSSFCRTQARLRGLEFWFVPDILFYGIPLSLAAARTVYVLLHWNLYAIQPWSQIFNITQGGLSIYGAFAGFLLVVYWRARRCGQPFFFWLDVLAPSIALGLAIDQMGHFIFQSVVGMPDSGKVAEYIEYAFRPSGFAQYEYFQPIALYQAFWQFFICALLAVLQYAQTKSYRLPHGCIFLLGVFLGCVGRFYCGFYYLSITPGLHFEQYITLIGAIFCFVAIVFRRKAKVEEPFSVELPKGKERRGKWLGLVLLSLCLPLIASGPKILDSKYNEISEGDMNITILNYHKVDDMNIALSVSPVEFDEQMAFLQSQGYNCITPKQLMDFIEQDAPLPEKPLLITFDDGYLDNYQNAYPIMKKYGFVGTIFIVTDYISSDPRFMTWDQVRELQANGFTIGSHTMQHLSLTELDEAALLRELNGSREALAAQLGENEFYFAYPTGTYNFHIADLVRNTGYRAAFTIRYGNVDKASHPYALERIPIFKSGATFRSFCLRVELTAFFERLGIIRS